MGNYMSCSDMTPIVKGPKPARVVLPGGEEVRQIREWTQAAELMLEFPNYFLVNSNSLSIGKRFSALSADEDLEFGNLYVMFPMKRVNSTVTDADMATVSFPANTAAKRMSSGGGNDKILPMVAKKVATENVVQSPEPNKVGDTRLDSEDMQGFGGAELFKYRSAVFRSRKPLLDTILEEPVLSR